MLLNFEYVPFMHMGKATCSSNMIWGCNLESLREGGGPIGVIRLSILMPSRQCAEESTRVIRILGMIKRSIVSRDPDVMHRLYISHR